MPLPPSHLSLSHRLAQEASVFPLKAHVDMINNRYLPRYVQWTHDEIEVVTYDKEMNTSSRANHRLLYTSYPDLRTTMGLFSVASVSK